MSKSFIIRDRSSEYQQIKGSLSRRKGRFKRGDNALLST